MRPSLFNKEKDFYIFKNLYIDKRLCIEDIATELNSNSFTIRKYLKLWNLYIPQRSHHRNKSRDGWNKLRKQNVCSRCGWVGPCDRAHIIPKKLGGTYASENIRILCPNCHRLLDRGLIIL